MRMLKMIGSRLTLGLAAIAALLAAVVLWIDLDPEPRHVTALKLDHEMCRITSAPDGKALVFAVWNQWGQGPLRRTYLLDLVSNRLVCLCEDTVHDIVFEPNGPRMAGYVMNDSRVSVWDRNTGQHLKRYDAKLPRVVKGLMPPLSFRADLGLVMVRDWHVGEDGEFRHEMVALESGKTWFGAGAEFEKLHEAQADSALGGVTTPDGKRSVTVENGQCFVTDSATQKKKAVPSLIVQHPDQLVGITPNGATVIVQTTKWRLLRAAADWFDWAYSDAGATAYPTPTFGTLFVDAASGRSLTFFSNNRQTFWSNQSIVTPDGKTLVMLDGNQIAIYDWPPARPWGSIFLGSAYVFLGVMLLGKMYHGYRWLRNAGRNASSPIPERPRPAAVPAVPVPTMSGQRGAALKFTDPWFGPHLPYDMIRLARKGWPTLARVVYLLALLLGLTVMWRTQGDSIDAQKLAEYAKRAIGYAYTLIIIQDLLVLVLLPVYVASAIAQEKENQTLESLTLTHLTDRELVLGKLGARLMHLGAVVLSGLPILAFLHLWGNVDITLLVYFETHTLCLLVSAGCVCIWVSTRAETVFGAISSSYPWMALIGFVSMVSALLMPWLAGEIIQLVEGGMTGSLTPNFAWPLLVVIPAHSFLVLIVVSDAIRRMDYLRRSERRKPHSTAGSVGLSDAPKAASIPGVRGQVRSKIHPLAWPIGEDALFWKECIKDGSSWSLNPRWLFHAAGIVVAGALFYRFLCTIVSEFARRDLPLIAYDFALTTYFISLAAYALAVVFQMTTSIAGEREHDTLVTLLMVPAERREILLAKWLGPWIRNWPILAIAYLGAFFGLACGIFGVLPTLALLVLPWPVMIFVGGLALWLSVMSRRVLFANMALVGVLGLLFIAHVAAGEQTRIILACYVALIGNFPWRDMASHLSVGEAALLTTGHHAFFLMLGGYCVLRSFRSFDRRD